MKLLVPWLAVMAVSAAALTACNSGGSSTPGPGPTCRPPSGTQYSLVYPAPNATAIPDIFGQVIIAASPALPSSWNVVVSDVLATTGGGTFTTATPPFPTPTASPTFANPTYQTSTFAGLSFPGEVVSVFLNNTASTCTPLGPLGQFTTQ